MRVQLSVLAFTCSMFTSTTLGSSNNNLKFEGGDAVEIKHQFNAGEFVFHAYKRGSQHFMQVGCVEEAIKQTNTRVIQWFERWDLNDGQWTSRPNFAGEGGLYALQACQKYHPVTVDWRMVDASNFKQNVPVHGGKQVIRTTADEIFFAEVKLEGQKLKMIYSWKDSSDSDDIQVRTQESSHDKFEIADLGYAFKTELSQYQSRIASAEQPLPIWNPLKGSLTHIRDSRIYKCIHKVSPKKRREVRASLLAVWEAKRSHLDLPEMNLGKYEYKSKRELKTPSKLNGLQYLKTAMDLDSAAFNEEIAEMKSRFAKRSTSRRRYSILESVLYREAMRHVKQK